MWSLKDPDTGRTYWQCTECDYHNKSAKSSKYKVERHVMRHHMGKPKPIRREIAPTNGVKKEVTEQDRQVEDLMGRLKDPTTSRIIWLCGKCNYTTSNSDKSRSSKFKMKRHILRLHIEGGRASSQNQGVSKAWNQSQYSAPGSSGRQHSQVEYSSRGYSSTHKTEAQQQQHEETVFINLKAEGGILDAELKREILKQQQQLLAQKAVENIPNPNFYYNYM